jgi:hypothetical protein
VTFDPATCIHCDPTADSLGAIIAIWILWLAPAIIFVLRRRIRASGWLATIASWLLATAGLVSGALSALASIAWLISSH